MEDKDIVKLFLQRKEDAISETQKKYGKYLYKISYGILENEEDVSECLNDTYLKVWNCIPPQNPERLMPFLGKIIRNVSLNRFKFYTAEKRGGKSAQILLTELENSICSKENTECSAEEDITLAIEKFLYNQSSVKRNIFILRYWYCYSVADISEKYNISEKNISVMLYRLRKNLKKFLEKEGIYI